MAFSRKRDWRKSLLSEKIPVKDDTVSQALFLSAFYTFKLISFSFQTYHCCFHIMDEKDVLPCALGHEMCRESTHVSQLGR